MDITFGGIHVALMCFYPDHPDHVSGPSARPHRSGPCTVLLLRTTTNCIRVFPKWEFSTTTGTVRDSLAGD
jgi:hypothetical protein